MSVDIKMTEGGKFVDFGGVEISKEWLDQYVEEFVFRVHQEPQVTVTDITSVSDERKQFYVTTPQESLSENQIKEFTEGSIHGKPTTVSDEAPRFVVSTHEYLNESQRKQIEKEFNDFHPTAKLLILDGGKVLTQIAKGI